jgi:hypothetical protein
MALIFKDAAEETGKNSTLAPVGSLGQIAAFRFSYSGRYTYWKD